MTISENTRRQIAVLARRSRARSSTFTPDRPTEWRPHEVLSPESGLPYTEPGAWDLVARRIEEGHEVEVIALRRPRGATGYVMKIFLEPGRPLLYVKVEVRSGRILGRSFHYSR